MFDGKMDKLKSIYNVPKKVILTFDNHLDINELRKTEFGIKQIEELDDYKYICYTDTSTNCLMKNLNEINLNHKILNVEIIDSKLEDLVTTIYQ